MRDAASAVRRALEIATRLPKALTAFGTEWARERGSAVLAVPSAVIPAETNYLLNPLHPDFRRIKIGRPRDTLAEFLRFSLKTA